MTAEELESIGAALRNIGSTIAERQRQESQGAMPPFQFFHDNLLREATRLQVNGASQLGAAVLALSDEIGATDNE